MRKSAVLLTLWSALLLSLAVRAEPVRGVDGRTVDVAAPQRVVVLNASLVELFFALGEGARVVGTDISVSHPPETAKLPKVGHPYHPSVEGILGLTPDVVVACEENMPATAAEQLRGAGLPVLVLENSARGGMEGLARRTAQVARLVGKAEAGQRLVAEQEARLAALRQKLAGVKGKPRVLFVYAHGPGEALVYGRDTGVHTLIELAGGQNAADFTTGSKPLTAEGLVSLAPEALLLLGRSLEAVGGREGVLQLPGVSLTPAGERGRIFSVDDTARWVGPRFPQFADTLSTALHAPARP